ncbi:hypothetical protein ASC94_00110 [Massilia sp. Root418]|nr:hypothetical protein ASC94_00110 [Massilia sp. Root418]
MEEGGDPFLAWREKRQWLKFGMVNVFIGANGGGKSTVLDLIDALRQPAKLASLPRENDKRTALTAFEIHFADEARLFALALPNFVDNKPLAANLAGPGGRHLDTQFVNLLGLRGEQQLFSFEKNVSKLALDAQSADELQSMFGALDCKVAYWEPGFQAGLDELIGVLNGAGAHLPGILSDDTAIEFPDDAVSGTYKRRHPFYRHDEDRVGVWLSDDQTQSNHVHVAALPAGWRRLAGVLAWLRRQYDAVCLLEEPETHLHPRLQRYLAREMEAIAGSNGLQLFIATHSTVFQQPSVWDGPLHLFEASGERILDCSSAARVLDALGLKGADISQTNGVIWVEGPSDRMYVKHWLALYAAATGKRPLRENADYSFALYGGSLLPHFSADGGGDLIALLQLNRNMALVMDRDLDFVADGKDGLRCLDPASAKARILAEMRDLGAPSCYAWVTDGYTVESYLPDAFRNVYFEEEGGRLKLRKGRKTDIAARYAAAHGDLSACSCMPEALAQHAARLYAAVAQWSS